MTKSCLGSIAIALFLVLPAASASAQTFANPHFHAKRASTPVAQNNRESLSRLQSSHSKKGDGSGQRGTLRSPGQLTYQGGTVVEAAQSHAVYVNAAQSNCTVSSCWGDPEGFLRDLGKSDFIHLTDQYTGRGEGHRYTVGANSNVTYPAKGPLTDYDMEYIAYIASQNGSRAGYNHIYHIFLPPGQDVCFDSSDSVCYSPDNYSTFYFCAYHSSFDLVDSTGNVVSHVLYSVEPYQNVSGCNVEPSSPNGTLADSTNSVLSHELFETITDPDGSGWINSTSNAMYGDEIGDECSFIGFSASGGYFDDPTFQIGDHKYSVQSEWSNSQHSCSTSPGGDD